MIFGFQKKSLKPVLLAIQFPKFPQTRHHNNQLALEISKAAKLFGIFSDPKFSIALEIGVPNIGSAVNFQLTVPDFMVESVSRRIRHLWPEHKIARADAKNIFSGASATNGFYLNQKYNHFLPMPIGHEISTDTVFNLLKTFSDLEDIGEGLALQIIIRPASATTTYEVKKLSWQIKMGWEARQIFGASFLPASLAGAEAVKLAKVKIAQQLFEVNVRLLAAAPSQFQSEYLIKNLADVFKAANHAGANELKLTKPRNQEKFVVAYVDRSFDETQKLILSAKELATLFHLPVATGSDLKLDFWQAAELEVPAQLAPEGVFVGYVSTPDQQSVFISAQDRRRHIAVIGHNQAGKNDVLAHMVTDDIKKGLGVAVIDAHGTLTEMILGAMPQNRLDDVIVFDAGDALRLLGLNLLEHDNQGDKNHITHEVGSIFEVLYGIGTDKKSFPVQAVQQGIALLLEDFAYEPATLSDILRVFNDADFRNKKLARATDEALTEFWKKEFQQALNHDPFLISELVAYVNSNFISLVSHKSFNGLTINPKSDVNILKAMDSGKIILVNLAGGIGAPAGALLGRVMLAKIFGAALARAELSQWQRRYFNLYINEFHNFSDYSLNQIISGGDKYLLNITIGSDSLADMSEKMRQTILDKFASLITLRTDAETACRLAGKFQPAIGAAELANIDDFRAYIRMSINRKLSRPFNIKIPRFQDHRQNLTHQIKEYAHLRHRS